MNGTSVTREIWSLALAVALVSICAWTGQADEEGEDIAALVNSAKAGSETALGQLRGFANRPKVPIDEAELVRIFDQLSSDFLLLDLASPKGRVPITRLRRSWQSCDPAGLAPVARAC